jgi:ABC-type Fe3+/spermidine/putrescine transport system ATPase subunit
MVFQNFALFPHMTVFDNVEFPLMIRRMDKEERRERVIEALRLIRMEEYEKHYPRQVSGGQQQRVGLARALVYRPKVLLLDEPLSNLDAKLREEMRFEIRELIDRLGITAVYVTHDQSEALALSDRVAVMNAGHIEQVGTPDEIYDYPQSRFVADFIGLSDFVAATVSSVDAEGGTVIVEAYGVEILIPAGPELLPGQSVLLFVRPNDVELLPASSEVGTNAFPATVDKMTYLGDRNDYRVVLGEGLGLRVQTDGKVRFDEGERVKAHLPVDHCRVILE